MDSNKNKTILAELREMVKGTEEVAIGEKAKIYVFIAGISGKNKDVIKAQETLREVKNQYTRMDYKALMAQVLTKFGHLKLALPIASSIECAHRRGKAYFLMTEALASSGKINEAFNIAAKIEHADKTKSPYWHPHAYLSIVKACPKDGNFVSKAREAACFIDNAYWRAFAFVLIGDLVAAHEAVSKMSSCPEKAEMLTNIALAKVT